MRVAFLGLGIMGSRMAANVARAGFELTVWNRTASTAERFCAEHSKSELAATPGGGWPAAEIVITMVVDGPQVESVLLGAEGAATRAREGTLFVDCSTIGPAAALAIGERLAGPDLAVRRCTGHRFISPGGGRDVDDHGGRIGRGLRASAARCSRRWAS